MKERLAGEMRAVQGNSATAAAAVVGEGSLSVALQ